MIKKLLSIGVMAFLCTTLMAQNFGLYPTNNATSASNRAPNTNNRAQITCSIYNQTDFKNDIPFGATIVFIGWYPVSTPNPVTNGNLKIYLENTTDVAWAKASNTWSLITAPMTTCYNGTVSIPNTPTPYGVALTTPFVYNGPNMYLAFEYTNAGTITTGTVNPTYYAYSSGNATVAPQTKGATSTATTTLPASVGATPSAFKACAVIGYTVAGTDAAIHYATMGSNIKANNPGGIPVNVEIRNNSSTSLTAGSYNILFNDGASTQTLTGSTTMSATSVGVVSGTINAPAVPGLKNYTISVNATGDTYLSNNSLTSKKFIFNQKTIGMDDFNDTAKWKNIVGTATLNVAAMPSNWSVINNDGGGTVGPFFIGAPTNNPPFEGQSLSNNFNAANGLLIDDWIVTPQINGYCAKNTDSLVVFLKGTDPAFVDSVQILVSPNGGNLVPDFTQVVAYEQAPAAAWGRFAYKLNLPPTTSNYRVAFRYFVKDGGSTGANSNYFSMDCPHVIRYNAAITANAGPDQVVATTLATLTGTASGTNSVSSTWTQISGPSATITNSTSASTPVTLTSTGIYCFKLTVTDTCNVTADTICINATIATGITTADVELISLSPNPAKDMVYLNASAIKGTEINVSIATVDGRIVYENNMIADEKMPINMSNLNTGIYFINVNGKEFKHMTKVIKE